MHLHGYFPDENEKTCATLKDFKKHLYWYASYSQKVPLK